MFNRLFRDHPKEVGETYVEHLTAAGGFGVKMIAGGIACVVHAIVPGLAEREAPRQYRDALDRMGDLTGG